MRATLALDNGATLQEAGAFDVAAWEREPILGPWTDEELRLWREYSRQLLAQRTLATWDLFGLEIAVRALVQLYESAKAGAAAATFEAREIRRDIGIDDGERIQPFEGPLPSLADVVPFRRVA